MVTTAPAVLVILDGASEPVGAAGSGAAGDARGGAPTSLERAATPALDVLCAAGVLERVRTVAPWLEAGSESAIPALLGWTPPAPVDRGMVEAAARAIAVADDERAWRIDVRDAGDGARAGTTAVRAAAAALAAALPDHAVHAIGGHRLLVVGAGPLPSLLAPSAAGAAASALLAARPLAPPAAAVPLPPGIALHVWPEGIAPPRLLDATTVMIAAAGAAAGIARLMGARVVTPAGATGRPGSDLAAKARAALAALDDGAKQVIVHVGGPDEAAHERNAAAKVAAIEAADALVIAPMAAALRARAGGTLRVCPDHGCDPATGLHDAEQVPSVVWAAGSALTYTTVSKTVTRGASAAPRSASAAPRLTERAVARLPVTDLAPRALAAA